MTKREENQALREEVADLRQEVEDIRALRREVADLAWVLATDGVDLPPPTAAWPVQIPITCTRSWEAGQ